ncbi:ribosome biogenesis protein 15 isoform X2 [Cimex lectularius]|uniref:RRM domain-containing protein n=1 Tax=Cimex lectularius TaxID=79782 RepID=A0A8I6R7J3_CIMLE|nr:ribosome biogenesis protein 15 isoform X2 [Cimex lectularius]
MYWFCLCMWLSDKISPEALKASEPIKLIRKTTAKRLAKEKVLKRMELHVDQEISPNRVHPKKVGFVGVQPSTENTTRQKKALRNRSGRVMKKHTLASERKRSDKKSTRLVSSRAANLAQVKKKKMKVEENKQAKTSEPSASKNLPKFRKNISRLNQKSSSVSSSKSRKSISSKKFLREPRGVVYFSHLPHGFYEEQLKKYCQQFGAVTGVYLPKSKIGNYRGYGFVEFKHPEVAEIVADTMNNYLMFNRLIKAKYIPPDQQKPWAFERPLQSAAELRAKAREGVLNRTKELTKEQLERFQSRLDNRVNSYREKIKQNNWGYDIQVGFDTP